MGEYLRGFMNWEQNNWARLLQMAKFAYNNVKNASTGYTPFELNCSFHLQLFFEDTVDPCSRSCSVNKIAKGAKGTGRYLSIKPTPCPKTPKRAHDKGVKPWGYTTEEKVWLNSKYIKTKQNQKLKAKLFDFFRILHPVGKQSYKIDLYTK